MYIRSAEGWKRSFLGWYGRSIPLALPTVPPLSVSLVMLPPHRHPIYQRIRGYFILSRYSPPKYFLQWIYRAISNIFHILTSLSLSWNMPYCTVKLWRKRSLTFFEIPSVPRWQERLKQKKWSSSQNIPSLWMYICTCSFPLIWYLSKCNKYIICPFHRPDMYNWAAGGSTV